MRYGLKPLAREVFKLTIDKSLKEDEVWRIRALPLFEGQAANVLRICEYGFSEILNNAADHSEGSTVRIEITIGRDLIEMMIADNGVGIFKKIQDRFHLEDPRVAVLELTKGKLTTDPKRHTGEGIFFVSRAFDGFIMQSGTLSFSHSEPDGDWIRDVQGQVKGTRVTMHINPNSDRTIQNVFDRFASTDQNYSFVLTQVPVALARIGSENLISRSQAKRLLARFEKFKEVSLDFKGIDLLGQAFADEVFRVFAQEHPQVKLRWVNANKDVDKMIRRAQAAA